MIDENINSQTDNSPYIEQEIDTSMEEVVD
jgi:hypothetical protein